MYYLIGSDGHEYGPFTPEQLRQWVADGRANAYSRVRRDDDPTWRALREIEEFADVTRPRSEAPPPPPLLTAEAIATEYLRRNPAIDIGSAFSRGWELLRAYPGVIIGSFILMSVVCIGVAFVPILGWIASPFITGALLGGLYFVFLRRIRGEPAEVGDVFAGFKLAYLNLLLANIVSGLLIAVGVLLCVLPGIYLAIGYMFTLALVIDKKMEFWTAMEVSRQVVHQHWWLVFGFSLVCLLVNFAGILACFIGIIVSAPLTMVATMYLYEDLFSVSEN